MSTAVGKMRAGVAVLVSVVLLTMSLGTAPATAADKQVTAVAGVNIRSGPSTSTKIVGGLYRGQTVTAISTSDGWTKIRFGGGTAYIASRYLTGSTVAASSTVSGTRVTTTNVNLRKGPGLSYDILRVVPDNTQVTLTGRSARGYVEVTVSDRRGWISSQYLARSGNGLPAIIGTRVTTTKLLIRTSSGSNHRVVAEVKKGTRLSVTGATQNGRAQVIYRQAVRWVTARYLSNSATTGPSVPGLPRIVGTRYATSNLNIWTSATGSGQITEVPRGEALSITGRTSSGRAQVIYSNAVRWVTAKYLSSRPPSSNPPSGSVPSSWAATERRLTAKTIRVHRALRARFPQIKVVGGWYASNAGEHPLGRAIDVMIPNYKSSSGRELGKEIAAWTRTNARSLDVLYVIWDQRIWNVRRAGEGWRFMADRGGDSANHKNHVHISVLP